jgi:hypothetical protein
MSKIPSYQEAVDEIGPDAMSFFMDMINQDNSRPGENDEESDQTAALHNKDLAQPKSVAEARGLPPGTHFVDPRGKRRKR